MIHKIKFNWFTITTSALDSTWDILVRTMNIVINEIFLLNLAIVNISSRQNMTLLITSLDNPLRTGKLPFCHI